MAEKCARQRKRESRNDRGKFKKQIGKAQEDGARAQVAADEGRVVSRVRSWRVLSTSVRSGFYSERDEKSS